MLNAKQWKDRIREQSRGGSGITKATFALVDQSLQEHPCSSLLWCLRGDLIQRSDDSAGPYQLHDTLDSYKTAASYNPSDPEPWESMGHYFNAIQDDPAKPEPLFRKAIARGAGDAAREALEDVVAQLSSTLE